VKEVTLMKELAQEDEEADSRQGTIGGKKHGHPWEKREEYHRGDWRID